MSKYSELFKDPRWQKKRLEILNRDNFKCVCCDDDKETLHVHHKWYEKGLKPWEYKGPCLVTLCESCHAREHLLKDPAAKALINTLLSRGFLSSDLIEFSLIINDMTETEVECLLVVNEMKRKVAL